MEELNNKIELNKERDFGELLTAGFKLLTQEWKILWSVYLKLFLPFMIILIMFYLAFIYLKTNDYTNPIYHTLGENIVYMILNFIGVLISFAYLKNYYFNNKVIDLSTIKDNLRQLFVPYLILSIFYGIMLMVGIVLLIIPGIYVAVAFSLYMQIKTFDEETELFTFMQSNDLIKGYWWFTVGIMLILLIVTSSISQFISIPFAVFEVTSTLTNRYSNELSELPLVVNVIKILLINSVVFFINFLYIAVMSCYYFSLKEKKTRGSLIDRIASISQDQAYNTNKIEMKDNE